MLQKHEAADAARAFLKEHHIGIIGTVGLDGQPYVSPVYFASLPDFSIYFATSHNTDKFKNLTVNQKVAFSVDAEPTYIVLSVLGTATLLTGDEREEGLRLIQELVDAPMATWPIKAVPSLAQTGVAVFKIHPSRVSFLNLNAKEQLDSVANYYYEILP